MVCTQFAQEIVNACLRARPNSIDDAKVYPPSPKLFVHVLHSRAANRPFCGCPGAVALDGATPSLGVVSKTCAPFKPRTISHVCRCAPLQNRRLSGGIANSAPHLQPERWDNAFRTQTGQNINVAVNVLRIASRDRSGTSFFDGG